MISCSYSGQISELLIGWKRVLKLPKTVLKLLLLNSSLLVLNIYLQDFTACIDFYCKRSVGCHTTIL